MTKEEHHFLTGLKEKAVEIFHTLSLFPQFEYIFNYALKFLKIWLQSIKKLLYEFFILIFLLLNIFRIKYGEKIAYQAFNPVKS